MEYWSDGEMDYWKVGDLERSMLIIVQRYCIVTWSLCVLVAEQLQIFSNFIYCLHVTTQVPIKKTEATSPGPSLVRRGKFAPGSFSEDAPLAG